MIGGNWFVDHPDVTNTVLVQSDPDMLVVGETTSRTTASLASRAMGADVLLLKFPADGGGRLATWSA